MIIKINNILYSKDSEIKYLKLVHIDKAFKYDYKNKCIGYLYHKGEVLSLLGDSGSKTNIAILLVYGDKKFALLIDDIVKNDKASLSIKKYIEDLINA